MIVWASPPSSTTIEAICQCLMAFSLCLLADIFPLFHHLVTSNQSITSPSSKSSSSWEQSHLCSRLDAVPSSQSFSSTPSTDLLQGPPPTHPLPPCPHHLYFMEVKKYPNQSQPETLGCDPLAGRQIHGSQISSAPPHFLLLPPGNALG